MKSEISIKDSYINAFGAELEKNAISLGSVGRRAWNLFGDDKRLSSLAKSKFKRNIAGVSSDLAARSAKYESAIAGAQAKQVGQYRTLQRLQSKEKRLGRKGLLERTPLKLGKRRRINRLADVRSKRKAAYSDLSKSTRIQSNAQDRLGLIKSQMKSREAPIRGAYKSEMKDIRARRFGNMAVRTGLIGAPTLAVASAIPKGDARNAY